MTDPINQPIYQPAKPRRMMLYWAKLAGWGILGVAGITSMVYVSGIQRHGADQPDKGQAAAAQPKPWVADLKEPVRTEPAPQVAQAPQATPGQPAKPTGGGQQRQHRTKTWKPVQTVIMAATNDAAQDMKGPPSQPGSAPGLPISGQGGGMAGPGAGGNAKLGFYQGGGMAQNNLALPGRIQPELAGCVLKFGTTFTATVAVDMTSALPDMVLARLEDPIYGKDFSQGGADCLAVPAGSSARIAINTQGVERGDVRLQICASAIDLNRPGGGILPLGCQQGHDRNGLPGLPAETKYAWGDIAAGIAIQTALGASQSLASLIRGVPGIFVNLGASSVSQVGADIVGREMSRPPVLMVRREAEFIRFTIRLNADVQAS